MFLLKTFMQGSPYFSIDFPHTLNILAEALKK